MKTAKILMLLLVLGILLTAAVPMVSAWWWDNDRDNNRYLYDDGYYSIPNYWRHYGKDVNMRNPGLPMDKGYYINLEREHREVYYDYLRDVYNGRNANLRRGYD
jgi:hypothetical protein